MTPALDPRVPARVHVVGIGGAGMSAIAEVLAAMGHRVSGSDLKSSAGLERLAALGVEVHVGHHADHLADASVVTRSTAVSDANPEVRAAREAGLPVLSRAEVLGAVTEVRRTIAVAGTHGKTTTSSMLALALRDSGLRPSFVIGGDVNEIGSGAAWDEGDLFVVEADESDGSFLHLVPHVGVVTNLEPDHLEYHGGFGALRDAFDVFVAGVDGTTVLGIDDLEGAALAERSMAAGLAVTTVGESSEADWRLIDVRNAWSGVAFDLEAPEGLVAGGRLSVTLPVPGRHNARNAAMAAVAAILVGADPAQATAALGRFGGVARRFEQRGRAAGVTFVDDYAHLPTEVVVTVDAATTGGFGRLVAAFQPHRFSRTEALWSSFGSAFAGVDILFVTDVYPSGEAPRPGVSGQLVVDAVARDLPGLDVRYAPRRNDLVEGLLATLVPGDLCLTMGAGDLTSVPDEVRAHLVEESDETMSDGATDGS
ncbi:MAG: UDP-N-acetylmuramate--L-alanine ligase [Actinomycetota bacterium]|nr:UDP-N-acetylmuramate--L-alanine ligase [Actinomycetota bacterium]